MQLTELVQQHQSLAPEVEALELYLTGTRDAMFGEGARWWMGPRLDSSSSDYGDFLRRAKETFVVHNLLGLVQRNHVDAVWAKEPEWTLRRGAGELELPFVTDWYRDRELQEVFYDAAMTLQYSLVDRRTRAVLRYFIPRRAVNDAGQIVKTPLEQSLQRNVRLIHVPNSQGGVWHEDGDPVAGYYLYSDKGQSGETRQVLEISALDYEFARQKWPSRYAQRPSGLTVVQQRTGADWGEVIDEIAYPLGGSLTIFDMQKRPLITEDVIIQQASLNTQWTYLNNFTSANTYLERIFMNALPPGHWENKDGEQGPFGNEYNIFKPAPYVGGNSRTNFIQGVPLADGNRTNPSVFMRTPSSSSPILENIEAHRHAIFDSVNQLHLLIAGDATATGVARVQAVQGFINSLGPTVQQLRFGLKWALETGLRLAAHFATDGAAAAELDADVTVNVKAVEKTSEERQAVLNELKAGVIDTLEAMRQLGVENSEEIMDRVKAEKAERVAQQQELFRQQQQAGEQEEVGA